MKKAVNKIICIALTIEVCLSIFNTKKVKADDAKLEMKGTKISHCCYDENGGISGGQAGDQGGEYVIAEYYSGWGCVLRYPDQRAAAAMATIAINAANNDNIGYDQGQRHTYWEQLEANNYDSSKISVPCEADCSAGVSAAVKGAGFVLNIEELKGIDENDATYNMRGDYTAHGFQVLEDGGVENLLAGDVLLNESQHTAMFVGNAQAAGGFGLFDIDDITINLDEQEFEFSGLPKTVIYAGNKRAGEWIFDKISQFIDFIVSLMFRGILMSLQGWAMSIQAIIDASLKFLEGS